MTSIVRTVYTFRVLDSPDVSYNTIIMGLWTWVEITIGILVSCMPTMPKFLHYLNITLRSTFSSIGSWVSTPRPISASTNSETITGISARFRKFFGRQIGSRGFSKASSDSQSSPGNSKGRYLTLGMMSQFSVPPFEDCVNHGHQSMGQGPATKRQDIEAGRSEL